MFAYCGNTPVNGCDPCGTCIHRWDFWNDCEKCGGQTIGDKWDGFTNWCSNTYNTTKDFVTNKSEDTTRENLQTYGCSFYKGSLVFSTALPFDKTAFSYGIIVMDDYYLSEKGEGSFSNTLNHEYGHFLHMNQIGGYAYTATVAVPSLLFAGLSNKYSVIYNNYYNLPWERIADELGGVQRDHSSWSNTLGSFYYAYTVIISQACH